MRLAILDKSRSLWTTVPARSEIKSGETVLYVSHPLIITMEMAINSPIGNQMNVKGLQKRLSKQSAKISFLSAYLLQERNNVYSAFSEYLDTQSKSLKEYPMFFTGDE